MRTSQGRWWFPPATHGEQGKTKQAACRAEDRQLLNGGRKKTPKQLRTISKQVKPNKYGKSPG